MLRIVLDREQLLYNTDTIKAEFKEAGINFDSDTTDSALYSHGRLTLLGFANIVAFCSPDFIDSIPNSILPIYESDINRYSESFLKSFSLKFKPYLNTLAKRECIDSYHISDEGTQSTVPELRNLWRSTLYPPSTSKVMLKSLGNNTPVQAEDDGVYRVGGLGLGIPEHTELPEYMQVSKRSPAKRQLIKEYTNEN